MCSILIRTAPRGLSVAARRRTVQLFSSSAKVLDDVNQDTRPPFNPSPACRKTRNPGEGWELGDGLRTTTELGARWKEDEKAGWKTMNLDEMDKPMLTSAVVPRPIAFVSTLSDSGIPNLAPFSYFSLVSHNPPLLSICFTLPANRPKDTRENIKATKEFTVNIISEPFVNAANSTSVEAPADIDEWAVSGLTPEPSELVKPPRVRESSVSFECKLYHLLDLTPSHAVPFLSTSPPDTTHTLVLGRIHRAHIRNSVLSSDGITVDTATLRAVSRLGGLAYARIGEAFELERPSWRKQESVVKDLMRRKHVTPKGLSS